MARWRLSSVSLVAIEIYGCSPRGGEPAPFVTTPSDESSPMFSSDGRYVAYVSDEAGREDVYVQPYPGPGARWPVSIGGGTDPVWSADGKRLFYRRGDAFVTVAVRLEPEFIVLAQQRMMQRGFDTSDIERNFDLSADGKRLVFSQAEVPDLDARFHVVLNWFRELR